MSGCCAAGVGLSAGTIQWGRRSDSPAPVGLTIRDLRLMALLHDTNYLSASQLTLLGWGNAERAAQERLKRLHDTGYLDRFRPLAARGTREWNYRLTQTGWEALDGARHGRSTAAHYTPAEITSISYTEHDLQLAAIILLIARAAAATGTAGLLDRMPFQWQGHRSGRIEPDSPEQTRALGEGEPPQGHAPASRAQPPRLSWSPTRRSSDSVGDDRFAVLIEYDRTDRPHKQTDRLRRYEHFLLDGWRHTRFAAHSTPPSVMFLTAREQPLRRLIQTADETFTAWHGAQHATATGGHPPRQAAHRVHQPRAHPRRRLDDATHPQPPTRSTRPGQRRRGCLPRPIDYDLPALFARCSAGDQP